MHLSFDLEILLLGIWPTNIPANTGNTIIFGVVQPEEIVPPAVVDITPAQVDPVVIPDQVLYGPPPPPPVIETPPVEPPVPPTPPTPTTHI